MKRVVVINTDPVSYLAGSLTPKETEYYEQLGEDIRRGTADPEIIEEFVAGYRAVTGKSPEIGDVDSKYST